MKKNIYLTLLLLLSTLLIAKTGNETIVNVNEEFNADVIDTLAFSVATEDLKIIVYNGDSVKLEINGYTNSKSIIKDLEWGSKGNTFRIKSINRLSIGISRYDINITL